MNIDRVGVYFLLQSSMVMRERDESERDEIQRQKQSGRDRERDRVRYRERDNTREREHVRETRSEKGRGRVRTRQRESCRDRSGSSWRRRSMDRTARSYGKARTTGSERVLRHADEDSWTKVVSRRSVKATKKQLIRGRQFGRRETRLSSTMIPLTATE